VLIFKNFFCLEKVFWFNAVDAFFGSRSWFSVNRKTTRTCITNLSTNPFTFSSATNTFLFTCTD
jgi:hypothetical protein